MYLLDYFSRRNIMNHHSDHEIRHLDTVYFAAGKKTSLLQPSTGENVPKPNSFWRRRTLQLRILMQRAASLTFSIPPGATIPDVLPFLFSRCRLNINKRIRCLHVAVNRFLADSNLDKILERYRDLGAVEIENKFPYFKAYRRLECPSTSCIEPKRYLITFDASPAIKSHWIGPKVTLISLC